MQAEKYLGIGQVSQSVVEVRHDARCPLEHLALGWRWGWEGGALQMGNEDASAEPSRLWV